MTSSFYHSSYNLDCIVFQRLALEGENKILKEKLNDYKDTLEKNDKKEKIRELNEKIVSLKIELSVREFRFFYLLSILSVLIRIKTGNIIVT